MTAANPCSGLVVAIDPGRSKCGLVLADCTRGHVLDALVMATEQTVELLNQWHQRMHLSSLVLGNGTSSSGLDQQLQHLAPIVRVNEAGTTLRARDRYWQIWPARGWRRLLPHGRRLPPCELDAIAALVLLEDHIGQQLEWPRPPSRGPGFRNVTER